MSSCRFRRPRRRRLRRSGSGRRPRAGRVAPVAGVVGLELDDLFARLHLGQAGQRVGGDAARSPGTPTSPWPAAARRRRGRDAPPAPRPWLAAARHGLARRRTRRLVEHRQPLGDDGVRILLAERHQHAAQAIGVRRRPRVAQQQVLGDDPGLLRFAGLEVGLGQLLLRGGQRRVEIAVDADLDQAQQRRRGGAAPSRGSPAAGAPPCRSRRTRRRDRPAGRRWRSARWATRGARRASPLPRPPSGAAARKRTRWSRAASRLSSLSRILPPVSSSSGSLVGAGVGQEPLGARHFVAAERRLGEAQRHLGGAGVALDDLLEQRLGLARRACASRAPWPAPAGRR